MDDDDFECETPSFPWSWRSALVYVGDWATSVLTETSDLVGGLALRLAADVNYRIDQKQAHAEMTRELETIIGETE